VSRPRLLLVARSRLTLPLPRLEALKLDALGEVAEVRLLAASALGREVSEARVSLVATPGLGGLDFHLLLPFRAARELRSFQPDAVLVQGAHETASVLLGRVLARSSARIILDVHGDWRAAPRLYGSPLRRLLAPPADLLARVAVRRADAIRTVSSYTTRLVRELGREPAAVFPAFMEAAAFLTTPPHPFPERRQVLFVGVLERYKNIDGLARAWRLVSRRVPDASLHLVGRGTLVEPVQELLRELPEQVRWTPVLPAEGIADELDRSTVLVLPSREEGMGRVVVEAFARGRPVVGAAIGGIRDLVDDGATGFLVDPSDPGQIADALVRVLEDRELAGRLGRAGRERAAMWFATPEEYARRVHGLLRAAGAA
jgi:glycosyltransferase involved in cell wall biosynthesis